MALPAENRLRRPAEFSHVLKSASRLMRSGARERAGGRAGDHLLLVAAVPGQREASRVGLSVSKRVGTSVVRNRIKRRLREIFRELIAVELGGTETNWDIVATARPDAATASYEELRASARKLISKIGARQ